MDGILGQTNKSEYKRVLLFGAVNNEEERGLINFWTDTQFIRRNKMWRYDFKSGFSIEFNKSDEYDDILESLDSKTTALTDSLQKRLEEGDDVYLEFICELKELYFLAQGNKADFENPNVPNRSLENINIMLKNDKNLVYGISNEITIKVLLEEALNPEEHKTFNDVYKGFRTEDSSFGDKLQGNYVKLLNMTIDKKELLNKMKKHLISVILNRILIEYLSVDRNASMQQDVFSQSLGVYWKMKIASALIGKFPEYRYVKLLKEYTAVKAKDILNALSNETAFTVLNRETVRDFENIKDILGSLANVDVIFSAIKKIDSFRNGTVTYEEALRDVSEQDFVSAITQLGDNTIYSNDNFERMKRVIDENFLLERDFIIESIRVSIDSKITHICHLVFNSNNKANLILESFESLRLSIVPKIHLLANIQDFEKFSKKHLQLQKVVVSLDEVCKSFVNLTDHQIFNRVLFKKNTPFQARLNHATEELRNLLEESGIGKYYFSSFPGRRLASLIRNSTLFNPGESFQDFSDNQENPASPSASLNDMSSRDSRSLFRK